MTKARILIVEDDPLNARVAELALRRRGYEVLPCVAAGEHALRQAEVLRPDLVLMDISLAGELDGIAAAGQIRERLDIPVLYLTAHSEEEVFQRAKESDPGAYLVKPFRPRELELSIELALHRHSAQKALRGSERLYRSLLEIVPAGIFWANRHGEFVFVNETWPTITGQSREQALDKGWTEALHPADRQWVINEWQRASGVGRPFKAEYRFVRPGGDVVWVYGQAVPHRDSSATITGYVGTVIDISERKRAQAKAHETHELLAAIIDYAPALIYVKDVNGRLRVANRQYENVAGVARGEAIGKTVLELFPKEMAKIYQLHDETVLATGVASEQETPIPHPDGIHTYLTLKFALRDSAGAICGVCGISTDITERKHMENELRQSRQFADSVVENIPDMIFVKDARELKFVRFNRAGEDLLGMAREDLYGKSDYDFFPKDQADFFTSKDREVLMQGQLLDVAEEPIETRRKGKRFLHTKKIPILDDKGRPAFLLGISEDITEHRIAERKIARLTNFYAALSKANQAIARAKDRDTLLEEICSICVEYGHLTMAFVGMIDFKLNQVVPVAHYGPAQEFLRRIGMPLTPGIPESCVPVAAAIREGKPYICNDFLNDPNTVPWREPAALMGTQATAAFPLREVGKVVGVLSLHVAEKEFFDPELTNLLLDLATDISVALDNFEGEARRIEAYSLLRKTVDRFDLVVRGANDGIWDWDIVEDKVYYSPRFKELLGYADEEDYGDVLFFQNLLHPDDRERTVEAVYRHLKRRGPFDLEYRLRRKDGSYGWFRGRGLAKWDELGRPLRFAGAITDITERRRAELEAKYAGLRLQALSDRLLEIQEMERKHISQELHDEIGQALTAVKIHLQAAKRRPGEASEQIDECICLADRALQQVRELSLNLRPPQLDDLGLLAALRWHLDRQARAAGWIAHFEADPSLARQDANVETACFRVAQEALTNVARHAGASNVWIRLHQRDAELHLSILDDGAGFDVGAARAMAIRGTSMGLLGMEKRVAVAGGRLEIISDSGKGTEVRAAFPIEMAEGRE